jgi:hypothetical protein
MKRAALLPLLFLAVSCGTLNQPRSADPIGDLEMLLRRTPELRMRYDVETTGAVSMDASGTLEWDTRHVRIDVSGTVGGEKKGTRYDRPYDRRRDIVESWVRIGLAHNLFRILSGRETETIDAHAANVQVDKGGHYTFDVIVDGKRIGNAELWVDTGGLPVRRTQTVRFPQGEMKVTERYEWMR